MKKQLFAAVSGCMLFAFSTPQVVFGQKDVENKIKDLLFTTTRKSTEVPTDISIQRTVKDAKRKLTFYYVQQTHQGLPILNSSATVVEKNGRFINTGNRLITAPIAGFSKSVGLSKESILDKVWYNLGEEASVEKTTSFKNKGIETLYNAAYSTNPIPAAEGIYFDGHSYRKVYDYSIEMNDHLRWLSIYADAETGEILFQNNWIVSCGHQNCSMREHVEGTQDAVGTHFLTMAPAPPPSTDGYRVVPVPFESPVHGDFALVTGPFDAVASPFGWHDDNGVAGEEYTITRGNNVYASDDRDDDNQPGFSPDGGASLLFDFPITNTDDPINYLSASITNLFYMNNIMHDIWYQYGFDEASGNFQKNNYGNGGQGNDFVQADAQDGSGTNNANFGTPPDGSNPRMQMFIWGGGTVSKILTINPNSSLAGKYATGKANFGPQIGLTPLTGDMAIAYDSTGNDPFDGCQTILPGHVSGKIAFVRKGGCDYDVKAANCEAAGAIAMVVMNTSLGNPPNMTVTNPVPVNIPSVIVVNTTGISLINELQANNPVNATLYNHGWYGTTDSDLDNMIIAHEYGHGISNRLTGGGSNSNCLFNQDQMGEGWSDWFGLMITIKPGDLSSKKRGVGTFVQNEENDGKGIRPSQYTTDPAVNGYSYAATNNPSITRPHGIGFVWASMLWDMSWALMDKYGFDPDVYNGTGGNNRAMDLVINGLKLQPCGPGFVDGRDAILEANELLYDSLDQCMLWKVFAKRGLGVNADQGSANNRSDQVEDFNMPAFCVLGLNDNQILEESLRIYPNPTQNKLFISIDQLKTIDHVLITDINGRVVREITPQDVNVLEIDTEFLNQGIYLVTVQSGDALQVRKIVKN